MTKTILVSMLVLLGVFGVSAQTPDFSTLTSYPVSRTIDGDTVELMVKGLPVKVRLIGVDTPETVHPQKPVEHYGKEASAFTRNLLRGESVYLVHGQEKVDHYGRMLGYLYRAPDGLFVNAEIIRQGYGQAYTKYPFRQDLMERFRGLQKHARESGKGLWSGSSIKESGIDRQRSDAKMDASQKPKANISNVIVYATKAGKKYHIACCRFVRKNRVPTKLAIAKMTLSACKVCKPFTSRPYPDLWAP
ncbi:MAG: thermonuclease family protein [Candidatus Latescibacterota bacterium]|nr:thermonuclease family protein [Candidatus Latescibacterota bacterium]